MAKRKRELPQDKFKSVDIEDHRHCQVCGKPIPPDQIVCSPACEKELESKRKQQKMWIYIMYGSIFFMIFVLLLGML